MHCSRNERAHLPLVLVPGVCNFEKGRDVDGVGAAQAHVHVVPVLLDVAERVSLMRVLLHELQPPTGMGCYGYANKPVQPTPHFNSTTAQSCSGKTPPTSSVERSPATTGRPFLSDSVPVTKLLASNVRPDDRSHNGRTFGSKRQRSC